MATQRGAENTGGAATRPPTPPQEFPCVAPRARPSPPSSWPSDVPTPDGDVIFSLGTPGNWAATIIVANAGVVDAIYGDLEGAGYTLISEADFGGLASRVYENDVYTVSVSASPSEDGTSTVTVQYIIAEKESQG
jgi:hypothetical protein